MTGIFDNFFDLVNRIDMEGCVSAQEAQFRKDFRFVREALQVDNVPVKDVEFIPRKSTRNSIFDFFVRFLLYLM